jgi:hypothetical protein
VRIWGTQPDAIDEAEDRDRWMALLTRLNIRQPAGGSARTDAEAFDKAKQLGYPVMVRPSYVLGGRAMEIVYRCGGPGAGGWGRGGAGVQGLGRQQAAAWVHLSLPHCCRGLIAQPSLARPATLPPPPTHSRRKPHSTPNTAQRRGPQALRDHRGGGGQRAAGASGQVPGPRHRAGRGRAGGPAGQRCHLRHPGAHRASRRAQRRQRLQHPHADGARGGAGADPGVDHRRGKGPQGGRALGAGRGGVGWCAGACV